MTWWEVTCYSGQTVVATGSSFTPGGLWDLCVAFFVLETKKCIGTLSSKLGYAWWAFHCSLPGSSPNMTYSLRSIYLLITLIQQINYFNRMSPYHAEMHTTHFIFELSCFGSSVHSYFYKNTTIPSLIYFLYLLFPCLLVCLCRFLPYTDCLPHLLYAGCLLRLRRLCAESWKRRRLQLYIVYWETSWGIISTTTEHGSYQDNAAPEPCAPKPCCTSTTRSSSSALTALSSHSKSTLCRCDH